MLVDLLDLIHHAQVQHLDSAFPGAVQHQALEVFHTLVDFQGDFGFGHKSAAALFAHQDTFRHQLIEGQADRGTADLKAFAEFDLRRQFVSQLQVAVGDLI